MEIRELKRTDAELSWPVRASTMQPSHTRLALAIITTTACNSLGFACRFKHDIARVVAEMMVRRICESHSPKIFAVLGDSIGRA